jgi:Effector Associated Constant Component 1
MSEATIRLTLENVPAAEQEKLIEDLGRSLEVADPTLKTAQLKPRLVTPDVGVILEIVLNAAAVTVLAHGIAAWLGNRQSAEISVVRPDGTKVTGKRLTPGTALEAIEKTLQEGQKSAAK